MSFCKHRVMDRCKKYNRPCIFSPDCFEPEEEKHMTNADRIRAMSDEELEDVIRAISIGYEPWCDHHCKMQGEDNCNICLKKWLQQPVK